jgi:hypothetical protein
MGSIRSGGSWYLKTASCAICVDQLGEGCLAGSRGGVAASGLVEVGTRKPYPVHSVWINLGKGSRQVAVKCCGGQWSVVEDRWLPAALGSGQQFMKIILNFVKIKILQP